MMQRKLLKNRPKKPYRHSANPNLISINRSYTAKQLALTLGLDIRTIYAWAKKGLISPINDQRPYLYHGASVKKAIRERNQQAKRPCNDFEAYCLPCRASRAFKDNHIEFKPHNKFTMRVNGHCHQCGGKINRIISIKTLDEWQRHFDN